MPYAKFTDSVNGDYAIPIKTESEAVYTALGASIKTQDTDLAGQAIDMLTSAKAKGMSRGVDLALTVKSGTGSTATWRRRIVFCPVGKTSEAPRLLPGTTAYGGVIKKAYFPRRQDFK